MQALHERSFLFKTFIIAKMFDFQDGTGWLISKSETDAVQIRRNGFDRTLPPDGTTTATQQELQN